MLLRRPLAGGDGDVPVIVRMNLSRANPRAAHQLAVYGIRGPVDTPGELKKIQGWARLSFDSRYG